MAGNNYPKLHNAMWPGLVGKGPDSEPPIALDTMLKMTAAARADGAKFDGVDLFLADPHTSIDSSREDIERLAGQIGAYGLAVGSVVAPVWPPVGGGSAMGSEAERERYLTMVDKACRIARQLRDTGIRTSGVVRIDSAASVHDWAENPAENQKKIAKTFSAACDLAEGHGERLAAEGEICWGGMHSWKNMVELLEMVGRPQTLGFQADMAHTLLYALGYNAPEHRILPENYDWKDRAKLDEAYKTLARALRPWMIDFHVAQNDATVKGEGSHDKTGRHCMVGDPNGKLDIVRHAGYWLRDDDGNLTKACAHICWDGCMFPNSEMMKQKTWDDILGAMVKVRKAHGWVQ
ncbi:MAG TPA: TIM barrel protein [Roseiarcus sp.]|nr:TIM barrel protein [Roseiarcus sp.]